MMSRLILSRRKFKKERGMPNQIHGHDVMQMMLASGKSYTKETLKKAIVEKFGEETSLLYNLYCRRYIFTCCNRFY